MRKKNMCMHSGTLLAGVLPALFLILASCAGLGGGQDGELLVGTGGFTTIQNAIDTSADEDTIIVLPGTYSENLEIDGKNITLRSATQQELEDMDFNFPGDPADYDIVANTVIEGGGSGAVVTVKGESDSQILRFTIQKGTNGIAVLQSSRAVITGNVIKDNTDGGIYLYTRNAEETPSRGTITENTITNNTSKVGGGIMLSYLSSATIENNTISGNTATDTNHGGGGIGLYYMSSTSVTVKNNTISGNTAYRYGGGIYVDDNSGESTVLITGNSISNNSAEGGEHYQMSGGGVYIKGAIGSCTVHTNSFNTNHAEYRGGGMYFTAGEVFGENTTPITMGNYTDHNTFTGNTADDEGNDIYIKE